MKKIMLIIGIIMFLFTTTVYASFVPYDTQSFGGKIEVTENLSPVFSNPNPSNGSTDVSISLSIWNITIVDPESDTFNWTIECTNGDTNYTIDGTNTSGSKNLSIDLGLAYLTIYTVYVNATDTDGSGNWNNETFWFETEATPGTTFTPYNTQSFGGKIEVQSEYPFVSNEYPNNNSVSVELYPTFSIMVEDLQGAVNITWKHNKTGSWVVFGYNSSCVDGVYTQNGSWANETEMTYNWSVHVNDTENHWSNETYSFNTSGYVWGNWSGWWKIGCTAVYDIAIPLDMIVNYLDASDLTSHYMDEGSPGWINADIDDSGRVTYLDASALTSHYGDDYR